MNRLMNIKGSANTYKPLMWFATLLLLAIVSGCRGGVGTAAVTTSPSVIATGPTNSAIGVALNTNITATFSGAMNPATITSATFTLKKGTATVSGTVSYTGTTAIFTPASNLAASTVYTASISTGARDMTGNALALIKTWSFTTGTSTDTSGPTVSSTVPVNAATSVALNTSITASFSEAMNPATISSATFTLKQGAAAVAGTVSYTGTTAIFTPTANLTASTVYTAAISTGVKDMAGNVLTAAKTWSFTTGTTTDTTAPAVSFTVPLDASTGAALNTNINATFSESMNPATIGATSFTVKQGTTPVAGAVSYVGVTALFTPSAKLAASTVYTATISNAAKDLAGNALAADYSWSFTTGTTADAIAPTVASTTPLDVATGVALNSTANAIFSEAMDASTITTTSFTLQQGATSVPGTVGYVGVTASFTPASNLATSTVYTATITTAAKDLAGNALAVNKVWSFTTGTTVAAGPSPVLLGTAGNYVVLAKTGVSSVPASVITGDVGVSPAATTYLTGFSLTMAGTTSATSPQVTGNLYGADMTTPTSSNLTTAVIDMGTAYTDAAGRPTPDFLNLGAGEIGGQTLVPGLYKWTTGVTISTNVTLSGAANDVWIFQIPGNLAMSAAKSVLLSGGAKAKNIFWQVAGTVNIGTTAHLEGILLSQTSITLGTGASMNGRALAQSAVSLDQSTVTKPAP